MKRKKMLKLLVEKFKRSKSKINISKSNINININKRIYANDLSRKQQDILIQYMEDISPYDRKMEKLNIWAVNFNPQFKLRHSKSYVDIYSKTVADITILRSKYQNKEIDYKTYKQQLNYKTILINSYKNEIDRLRGNDNFQTSFANETINALIENIWYKYFDPETGEPSSNGVMFRDLDEEGRKKVLKYIYNTSSFFKGVFSEEEFINKTMDAATYI